MAITINDLTANRLNAAEPQRGNNGKLHILGLQSIGGSDTFGSDDLVVAVQSFPVPKSNSGMIEMPHMNETRKYAGKATYDDMSVTYKDLVIGLNTSVSEILYAWRSLVQDPNTGKIGYTSDYKKNGYVVLFDGKGLNQRIWNLYGIWPSSYDPGEVDQDDDNYNRVTVTLSIDKMVLSPTDTPATAWSASSYPQ